MATQIVNRRRTIAWLSAEKKQMSASELISKICVTFAIIGVK